MRRFLLVLVVLVAACSSSSHGPGVAAPTTTTSSTSTTLDPTITVVAAAHVSHLAVFDTPGAPVPSHTLDNPRPLGGPLVLVVTRVTGPDGWIQTELPVRPNGSVGWVRTSDVGLTQHNFKIVVSLSGHQISVYQGHTVIDQEPIGVGRGATPTPGGTYYTEDFVKVTPPTGPYGPYAYGLSGFSDVLTSFGGGPGQLAIHGTNDPSGLGTDVSHGCIRMSNEGITRLAAILPLGVPVEVDT